MRASVVWVVLLGKACAFGLLLQQCAVDWDLSWAVMRTQQLVVGVVVACPFACWCFTSCVG